MTVTPSPRLPFERVGDYEVLASIAEGGMGSVWLGRSISRPGELVALKVIREDHGRNKDFVAMLVDEASIASRMSHPNILAIRSMGHDGKRHFLVMDLLRGHSLFEVVRDAHARGKRLPVEAVAWMGARIADALHYAHELKDDTGAPYGVVHRDVNPANIFLTNDGVPRLIDFGLAKARDRIATTAIGVVKGKLAYLAPEQARGQAADRRSDVFALGVTLWEVTLDRRLFLEGSDLETVQRVRDADVPDPRTLEEGYPDALAEVLDRALAREPGARWQTAAELRDALDAFVNGPGKKADAATLRAALRDLFADETPAEWQRLADAASADTERTRVWEEPKEERNEVPREVPAPPLPAPSPPPPATPVRLQPARVEPARTEPARAEPARAEPARAAPAPSATARAQTARGEPARPSSKVIPAAMAIGGILVGGLLVALLGRSSQGDDKAGLERRVARIEDLLGLADTATATTERAPAPPAGGATVSADDRAGACDKAKIAGYRAWQDAVTKSKLNARPALGACGGISNEKKKQSCFFAAEGETRAIQAARDAAIGGGMTAREAVKAVKDDPKNEAIAAARTASEAAFATCADEAAP